MSRWILACVATLALAGCGDDSEPALRGSLSSICDLEFSSVRARLLSSSVTVEYVRSSGLVALRVSVDSAELSGPGTVDLLEHGEISGDCEVPALVSGSITFSQYTPEDGAPVSGHFEAALAGPVGDVGILGEFDATLQDAR